MMLSQASLVPLLVITFCTWCVYLGGLASMQAVCEDVPSTAGTAMLGNGIGFPPGQPCSAVYSFWWFVMAFELVVIVFTIISAISPTMLITSRMSAMGLFVIATILYIDASYAFYSLEATSQTYWGDVNGPYIHTIRTVVAGAIMTTVMNGLVVIVLGMREEDAYAHRNTGNTYVEKPVVGVVGPVHTTTIPHHTTGIATAV